MTRKTKSVHLQFSVYFVGLSWEHWMIKIVIWILGGSNSIKWFIVSTNVYQVWLLISHNNSTLPELNFLREFFAANVGEATLFIRYQRKVFSFDILLCCIINCNSPWLSKKKVDRSRFSFSLICPILQRLGGWLLQYWGVPATVLIDKEHK